MKRLKVFKKKLNYILILAREGSTRVKNKNLRKIGGHSLISRKIKSALNSNIGKVFLSTNSSQIKKIGIKMRINVIDRPQKYSGSFATTFSSVLHFLRMLKKEKIEYPDYLTILPPTFPFLTTNSIRKAYKKLVKNKNFNSISSYTLSQFHPFTSVIKKRDRLIFDKIKYLKYKPEYFERTQDWPPIYNNCAAIRISKVEYFDKFLNYTSSKYINFTFDKLSCIGLELNSKESIDINTYEDLKFAKKLN